MSVLGKRRILVGITGGIAAYKVPQLVRLLTKQGAEVKVVCTASALRLVGEDALRTVCGNPVYRDGLHDDDMDHIRLAEWADTFLISPATANTIAKIAHGISDNLLSTLALSIESSRIVIAPAMNTAMWLNPATQSNVAALQLRGIVMLPVGVGELACGTEGAGRMLAIEEIAAYVASIDTASSVLHGKKVLISLGPTEEAIDPVRVITNKSSGKMGVALARAALMKGALVTIVAGPTHVQFPQNARVIPVKSALEMLAAMREEFERTDICIMAAAVGDYRPVNYSETKIKRNSKNHLMMELEPNPDILADLGQNKGSRFLVGFALETGEGEQSAREKMARKGCDIMVLNNVETSLGKDSTHMTLLYPDGRKELCPSMEKTRAAGLIMERIAAALGLTNE